MGGLYRLVGRRRRLGKGSGIVEGLLSFFLVTKKRMGRNFGFHKQEMKISCRCVSAFMPTKFFVCGTCFFLFLIRLIVRSIRDVSEKYVWTKGYCIFSDDLSRLSLPENFALLPYNSFGSKLERYTKTSRPDKRTRIDFSLFVF